MKLHELNGKKVLAEQLPAGATDPEVFQIRDNLYIRYWLNGKDYLIDLPPGNYQLLGRAGEFTEEQLAILITECVGAPVFADYDYKATRLKACNYVATRLESWQSFCRLHGIEPGDLILIDKI